MAFDARARVDPAHEAGAGGAPRYGSVDSGFQEDRRAPQTSGTCIVSWGHTGCSCLPIFNTSRDNGSDRHVASERNLPVWGFLEAAGALARRPELNRSTCSVHAGFLACSTEAAILF